MIEASSVLDTASCPQCDLLFSVAARPTLTDEEREAIAEAANSYADGCNERCVTIAVTLRNLLERTK
jgi:hypothetical protein